MSMGGTNSVQGFIRTVAFLLTFVLVGGFLFVFTTVSVSQQVGVVLNSIVLILSIWVSLVVARMFYILPEWERMVLLRLGKFSGVHGPGFFIVPPFIFSVASIVDIRIMTQQVEATATLTKDNVPTRVTAALEYEIEDPQKAVIEVSDFLNTIIWLSTESLKNTIGGMDLKELLSNRDEIAAQLRAQIDESAGSYGINVRAVRITDIDTPPELVEELAVIARARRAAQAKQIQAHAEVLVAQKIAEASKILAQTEGGFRLREIQNMSEISKEESTTIIIYPFNSSDAKNLAHTAVSQVSRKE